MAQLFLSLSRAQSLSPADAFNLFLGRLVQEKQNNQHTNHQKYKIFLHDLIVQLLEIKRLLESLSETEQAVQDMHNDIENPFSFKERDLEINVIFWFHQVYALRDRMKRLGLDAAAALEINGLHGGAQILKAFSTVKNQLDPLTSIRNGHVHEHSFCNELFIEWQRVGHIARSFGLASLHDHESLSDYKKIAIEAHAKWLSYLSKSGQMIDFITFNFVQTISNFLSSTKTLCPDSIREYFCLRERVLIEKEKETARKRQNKQQLTRQRRQKISEIWKLARDQAIKEVSKCKIDPLPQQNRPDKP
jgi:hypothetical protein